MKNNFILKKISILILKGTVLTSILFFLLTFLSCSTEKKKSKLFPGRFFLRNAVSPLEVTFHPNLGNFTSQITYKERELLYSPYYSENLQAGSKMEGIPFLFPFANRLETWAIPTRGGLHPITENSPILKDQSLLPMHGFFYYKKGWEVEFVRNSELSSSYESTYQSKEEDFILFPFPFQLKMELELEENSIIYILSITNDSKEPMPLSVGFHPYFWVPKEQKSEARISVNAKKVYIANEKLLPTGKFQQAARVVGDGNLGETFLDHSFTEFIGKGTATLHLSDLDITISLEQGFDHFQIFNPKDKDFVCIEPMLGPVNSFFGGGVNTGKPVHLLPAGKTWKGVWKIQVDSKFQ